MQLLQCYLRAAELEMWAAERARAMLRGEGVDERQRPGSATPWTGRRGRVAWTLIPGPSEGEAQGRGPDATLDSRPQGLLGSFSFLPRNSCLLLVQSLVCFDEEDIVRGREVNRLPSEVVGDVSPKQPLTVPAVLFLIDGCQCEHSEGVWVASSQTTPSIAWQTCLTKSSADATSEGLMGQRVPG
jgi:hypothetical protein